MNKTTGFGIGIIVVIIIIAGIYASKNKNDDAMMQNESKTILEKNEDKMMQKEEGEMMEKSDKEMMVYESDLNNSEDIMVKKGSYETYSPEKLALSEAGKVVLFFRASWCPTCRALDANIHPNMGSIPEGVTILDVDYDNSTALKQKYGVTYQHTLVQVDASGKEIAKWTGSPTLSDLVSKIK